MSQHRRVLGAGVVGAVLVVAGCTPQEAGLSGQLANFVSSITAPYALLDLPTGTVTWRNDLPDAATNASYRDQVMVFRRVGTGTGERLVGIFEVTQAQWARLDSSAPWQTVHANVVPASAHAGNRPAYSVDFDTLTAMVGAYSPAGTARLTLPTLAQWHLAAGTTAGWTWGATTSRAQLDANAWVFETIGGTAGPRAVGTRGASSLGFFDLHGNVWEWTQDGTVHGGSWRDGWRSSRAEASPAVAEGIDSVLEHALIGARLVLIP